VDSPLVSCICPTWNRHDKLPQLFDVFASQTCPRKELLICDDSPEPWRGALPDDVRYWYSPKRLTIGAKRNFLTHQARGSIVVAFDDDDLYARDYIHRAIEWLRDAEFAKLAVFRIRREIDGSEWEWDTTKCGESCYVVSGDGTTEGPVPADKDPLACDTALWGYGFSYCYRRYVGFAEPFADISKGEDYEWACRVRKRFRCKLVTDSPDAVIHVIHERSTSLVFPQKRINAGINAGGEHIMSGMTPMPEGQPLRLEPGKRYEAVALLKSNHSLRDLRAKLAAAGLSVQTLEEGAGGNVVDEAPSGYRYVHFVGIATRASEFPWQLPRPWRYIDKTRVVHAWVGAGAGDDPDFALVRVGAGAAQRHWEYHQSIASMRQSIDDYLADRPRAKALHELYKRRKSTIGVGDAGPCGNFPLTPDFASAANDIIKKAPSNIPLGNGVLTADQIQNSVCTQMQDLANQTILGYSRDVKKAASIVTVVNDAEQLGASMVNLFNDLHSSRGIDVTKVTADVQAMVGSITAILIATGVVTADTGVGAAIGAAIAMVGVAIDTIASLLQKKPICQDYSFFDSNGNKYGGRIERLCVSGLILSKPNDPSWRKFPTTDDVLFGFGSWFDLPHDDIRLDKRGASWQSSPGSPALQVASDAKEAQYWRPIDLAFSDYRRFECEQAAVTLDYIESLGLSQEQKSAVYAFKTYFFEMWKKAAEYKLNGLDADWQMSLARAILNWNMAHEPGASGPLKLYAAPGPPLAYTQQGSCQDVLSSSSIPIFLMMANDNYVPGQSLTDLDPAQSNDQGFISGKDSQGTYVLLHTGDVREGSADKIAGLLEGLGKGIILLPPPSSQPSSGTLTRVALGGAAVAALAAAGVGVWAAVAKIGYGAAWGRIWYAFVKQAQESGRMLTRVSPPLLRAHEPKPRRPRRRRRDVARRF
jgi:hypothetical protein